MSHETVKVRYTECRSSAELLVGENAAHWIQSEIGQVDSEEWDRSEIGGVVMVIYGEYDPSVDVQEFLDGYQVFIIPCGSLEVVDLDEEMV